MIRLFIAAAFLCSPLMLGGCILAAAGAGAGAGVAISDSEHHDGHDQDNGRADDGAPAPVSSPEQP